MLRGRLLLFVAGMVLGLGIVTANAKGEGFFYAIEPPDGADRLYRIDWDGTVTPIGAAGTLGFPSVAGLIWDSNANELYGYDNYFRLWLQIDTKTGTGRAIAPFDRQPRVMSFDPVYSVVYVIDSTNFRILNPVTGLETLRLTLGSTIESFAKLPTSIAGRPIWVQVSPITLFLQNNSSSWTTTFLTGYLPIRALLFWDNFGSKLYHLDGRSADLFEVNLETGEESLAIDWSWNISHPGLASTPTSITFVPDNSAPVCDKLDADDDGDTDLADFAHWQNCFSGPTE